MIIKKPKNVTPAFKANTSTKAGAKSHPTAARVRELLDYHPETDTFRWKVSRGRSKAGSVAGSPDGAGNVQIRVDGRLFTVKQLARAHVSGIWVGKDNWHNRKLSSQYRG